jgi:hypothetical protein
MIFELFDLLQLLCNVVVWIVKILMWVIYVVEEIATFIELPNCNRSRRQMETPVK